MPNKLQVEYISIDDIKTYPNNAKLHPAEQIEQIKKSIQEFGFNDPIAIDEKGVIIEGHGRYIACTELGIKEVPIIRLEGLDEEHKKAYMLVHNKLTMNSDFDLEILMDELDNISFDMSDYGFDMDESIDWFESRRRYDNEDEDEDEEYKNFKEKFEIKKTTDDCYTPDEIYEVIANWVENEYGVSKKDFIRPFYPGGDYTKENYTNKIVVDNPPFSIEAEIVKFYTEHNIKYFLFAPSLVGFSNNNIERTTIICTNAEVTYENGAKVVTSFLTNMDDFDIVVRTEPNLYKLITDKNKELQRQDKDELGKYTYPNEVLTMAMCGKYAKYGVEYKVKRKECIRIAKLDNQTTGVYGGGLLLAEKAAAEKATAEKAAAEKATAEKAAAEKAAAEKAAAAQIVLSPREIEIQRNIGK